VRSDKDNFRRFSEWDKKIRTGRYLRKKSKNRRREVRDDPERVEKEDDE
jgi:hypothetical protein